MLPSNIDISYFLEVASTLNVSRAAERIGITQPSLSMSLKRLETAVGTQLLVRSKSGVQLTQAGEFFAQRGKSLLQEWDSIRSGTLRHESELMGRFSLGCHVAVARYTLPEFLPGFLKENPKIEIQLEHDLSRKITEQVISYRIDFGIVVNPVSHPDLVIHELCKDRVTVWGKEGRVSDTLIYDPSLQQTQSILHKLEAKKIRFRRSVTSSSLEVIADLAAQGAGTAILPTRVALYSKAKLKPCGKGMPYFEDRVCLIYRADAQRTVASKGIIAAIKRGIV